MPFLQKLLFFLQGLLSFLWRPFDPSGVEAGESRRDEGRRPDVEDSLKKLGDNIAVETLLERGRDSEARTKLAQETGLPPGDIERGVICADLCQVNLLEPGSLTQSEALILAQAGVDGLAGLARADWRKLEQALANNPVTRDNSQVLQSKLKQVIKRANQLFHSKKKPDGFVLDVVTHTHNLLVVSDLHLGSGWDPRIGKLDRNEDFLYDEQFAHFLAHYQSRRKAAQGSGTAEERPWTLLVSGDFVDFLQVSEPSARNIQELGEKAKKILDLPCPSGFQEQPVRQTRKWLNDLCDKLETIEGPPERKREAMRLIAEVKVLLARGDIAVNLEALNDFEKLVEQSNLHFTPDREKGALDCYLEALKAFDDLKLPENPRWKDIEQARRRAAAWEPDNPDPHNLSYEDVRWGLGSIEPDNVWRVHRIYAGHPIFFRALAWFLAHGNRIIIQTGNHDIELFWPEVHTAFRDVLVNAYESLDHAGWKQLFDSFGYCELDVRSKISGEKDFEDIVEQEFAFLPWMYYEPGVVYIEHGNQYETANSWATYLNPRFVGLAAGRMPRGGGSKDDYQHPRLFWPWGSLIVRFIFNRIEETHPFADQLKPITRYFTWALSKDFVRFIGLLILTIPGIIAVMGQAFVRGVVEGWFGTTRSIAGLFNVFARGWSTWLTWVKRLVSGDWIKSIGIPRELKDRGPLTWPVFRWENWAWIVDEDRWKRQDLSKHIPDLHQNPRLVERVLSDDDWDEAEWEDDEEFKPLKVNAPSENDGYYGEDRGFESSADQPPSLWRNFLTNVSAIALQFGLLLVVIWIAYLVTGWQQAVPPSIISDLGSARMECELCGGLFVSESSALFDFLSDSTWPWWLAITTVGLLGIPFGLRVYVAKQDKGWLHSTKWCVRFLVFLLTVLAIAAVVVVALRLRCNLSYYKIPRPGPWAAFSALPQFLGWLILLIMAVILPLKEQGDRKRTFVGLLISSIGLVYLFYRFYTQSNDMDWMRSPLGLWGALILWMIFAYCRWGHTPFFVLFTVAAAIGLLALEALILIKLNIAPNASPQLPGYIITMFISLGIYWLIKGRAKRIICTLVGVVAVVALIVVMLTLPRVVFEPFFDISRWEWLPLWAVWGLLGIWLLENKNNPFQERRNLPLRGWIGDVLRRWIGGASPHWSADRAVNWISQVLDGAFTVLLELGLIVILLGLAAQLYLPRGRPIPPLLASFVGDRSRVISVLATALIFLIVGGLGRALWGLAQTENVTRVIKRHRRDGWMLDVSLGLGTVGLIVGSLWVLWTKWEWDILNEPQYSLIVIAILTVLGGVGWYISKREPSGSGSQSSTPARIILTVGILILLLSWGLLVYNACQEYTPMSVYPIKVLWPLAAIFILVGLMSIWLTGGKCELKQPKRKVLINATSWGFLLLAGMLTMAVIVRSALGIEFSQFVGLPSDDEGITGIEDSIDETSDKTITDIETLIDEALFDLRLERAIRLSYTDQPDDENFLRELRSTDITLAVYYETVLEQPDVLHDFAEEIRATSTIIEITTIANELDALANNISTELTDGMSEFRLHYEELVGNEELGDKYYARKLINFVSQCAKDNQNNLTLAESQLAELAVELESLAAEWEQIETNTIKTVLENGQSTQGRLDKLAKAWFSRRHSGNTEAEHLRARLNRGDEIVIQTQVIMTLTQTIVIQTRTIMSDTNNFWSQFGQWEQINFLLWLRLNGADIELFTAPLPDFADYPMYSDAATMLSQLDDRQQAQADVLQALSSTLRQRRHIKFYYNMIALAVATLALVGLIGTGIVNAWADSTARHTDEKPVASGEEEQLEHPNDLTRRKKVPVAFDAEEQLERLNDLARRKQGEIVRKITRSAAVALSFTFSLGVIAGAYIIGNGLFTGDLSTALRNGTLLTAMSWLGRRLLALIPEDIVHGAGYLSHAADEVRYIINHNDPGAPQAMRWVPYLIFGHDHLPAYHQLTLKEDLDEGGARQNEDDTEFAPQWYVNSGSWVQAYTGQIRYRREDEDHSIFIEIVPGPETTGVGAPPTLLRWDDAAGRPAKLHHLVVQPRESVARRTVKAILSWIGLASQDYVMPESRPSAEIRHV